MTKIWREYKKYKEKPFQNKKGWGITMIVKPKEKGTPVLVGRCTSNQADKLINELIKMAKNEYHNIIMNPEKKEWTQKLYDSYDHVLPYRDISKPLEIDKNAYIIEE